MISTFHQWLEQKLSEKAARTNMSPNYPPSAASAPEQRAPAASMPIKATAALELSQRKGMKLQKHKFKMPD